MKRLGKKKNGAAHFDPKKMEEPMFTGFTSSGPKRTDALDLHFTGENNSICLPFRIYFVAFNNVYLSL